MTSHLNDNTWVAVAQNKELKQSPLRVYYQGIPVVIYKNDGHIHALKYQCSHRGTEV